MMNWALKAKKIRVVFRYFDMMNHRDIKKSVVTYNIAINACKEVGLGGFARAMKMKTEMESAGFVPNDRTFTSLTNVCVKEGRFEEAMSMKKEMQEKRIKFNDQSFNSLINVCVK